MLSAKQQMKIICSPVLVIAFLVCVVPFPVFVSSQLTGNVVNVDAQGQASAGEEVEITFRGWRFVSLFRDDSATVSVTVSHDDLSGELRGTVNCLSEPEIRWITGIYIDQSGTPRKLELVENRESQAYLLEKSLSTGDSRFFVIPPKGTTADAVLTCFNGFIK
jgi:hypothetical protein